MEDEIHKPGLYRWTRQSKPKVLSRSHKVKTSDDIQDWIKKVESASDKAADVAFGLVPAGKQRGKAVVQQRTGHVRDQENAFSEARELLTAWVNDNVSFGEEDGFDDLEAWRKARAVNKSQNNVNSDSGEFRWDSAYDVTADGDIDIDEAAIYERVKRLAVGEQDPYAHLYDMDENEAVSSVMQNMMKKEVVKDTFKQDLGFDSPSIPDPRTKMELRHKMVKQNREKRQMDEEKKKLAAQMKKEARLKAQQLILKEQREREARARKEEIETRKEMAKIRKQLQEDLRRKEEERLREFEEREELNRMAREELERQREAEEYAVLDSFRQERDRKKQHMVQMELFKAKMAAKNLKILHRHFTAWYDLVLSKRLLMGKVKAMRDWKVMVRVWGAWRSHVRSRRLEMETEIHERNIIDSQRKALAAERHFTSSVLRKCFLAWRIFTDEEIERRELQKEQERTRNKMASLLSAVAEGKLGKKEEGEEMNRTEKKGKQTGRRERRPERPATAVGTHGGLMQSTDSQKLNQMFNQPVRQAWDDAESVTSSVSDMAVNQKNLSSQKRPASAGPRDIPKLTDAWQVNRQHLKLTKDQIANLTNKDVDGDEQNDKKFYTDASVRKRFGTQPWMNRHYVVNNFEHRYTAQQQALKEQQNQIKEQRRQIEELQYQQRQAALRQELAQGGSATPGPLVSPVPAPPQGPQIPRNDEEKEKADNRGFVAPTQPENGHDKKKHNNLAWHSHREPDPESSDLPTERSELSSVTNVTSITSASQKTENSKYLQVLKNMEERAAERARLKAEREERRRLQEEQKQAELQRIEEERLREIEEEKKARAEAYRQKKRAEKQKEEERRKQQEREAEMIQRADNHYQRSLMKYRGLLPFKKLISMTKRNELKASKHRDKMMLRQCLNCWKEFTKAEVCRKQAMADQMHEFLLTKHSFQRWRQYKHHQEFLERRAERQYAANLRARMFTAWVHWVAEERERTLCNLELAREHYLRSLVKKAFQGWRYLPQRIKREEERQKRKLELRMKVAQLVPDYEPTHSVKVDQSGDLT